MQSILALLARIPADHWGLDLAAVALVVLGCVAVLGGVLPPDQLPAAIDAAVYVLGLVVPAMAARAAALRLRAKTASAAALSAAEAARGRHLDDALAKAVAAANVLRLPPPKEGA